MGHWVESSHNHVDAYLGSGYAYAKTLDITNSNHVIKFPSLTRWIHIRNNGAKDIKVSFNTPDMAKNLFIYIKTGESTERLELKTPEVILVCVHGDGSSNVSIVAGLTSLSTSKYPASGSLSTPGLGGLR